MHLFISAMRDDEEEDPKKPHPGWGGHKGDNAAESEEHGPDEVGPHGRDHEDRGHHMHVRC
jgi:hypothetical protein